jgi:phage protein D
MARSSFATILTDSGTDITDDLRPHLLSVEVTQRLHGRADEVSIKLEDREGDWVGDLKPEPGDRIRVRFELTDWREEGDDRQIDWGAFEIDKVRLTGPPSTVDIGAQSAYVTRSMRQQKRTQGWEQATLKEIAGEIASRHDLELRYTAGRVPKHDRLDQTSTPDLRFLSQQCKRWNLRCRVDDERLIVASDPELVELEDPVRRTAQADGDLLACTRYELEERTYSLARKSTLSYDDPVENESIQRTVEDTAAPDSGETKTINERVRSPRQAELRAAGALEWHNKEQFTASVSVPGRPQLRPGFVVPLEGFERFDGPYAIDEASHSISRNGYQTTATIRKRRDPLI